MECESTRSRSASATGRHSWTSRGFGPARVTGSAANAAVAKILDREQSFQPVQGQGSDVIEVRIGWFRRFASLNLDFAGRILALVEATSS